MASAWNKPGAVGGGLAAAMTKQKADFDAVTQKFVAQYKMTPLNYVGGARHADRGVQALAIAKMGEGGASYGMRSQAGQTWTENPTPTNSPSAAVIAYHDAENSAKALAKAGKLEDAVKKVDEAISLREYYEQGLKAVEGGHQQATTLLRARRNSMINLIGGANDHANEVAAITLVRTFYTAAGVPPPAL